MAWRPAQRYLHWGTAALVIILFPLGWVMVGLPFSQLLAKFVLYQVHKTIGIVVFALVCARVTLRGLRKRPGWDEDLPRWQIRAAGSVHLVLYGLLIVTPVLGYLTAATAPARVPTLFMGIWRVPHLLGPDRELFAVLRQFHAFAATMLILIACLHAAAAIHNHLRGRPSLLRMWKGRDSSPGTPR